MTRTRSRFQEEWPEVGVDSIEVEMVHHGRRPYEPRVPLARGWSVLRNRAPGAMSLAQRITGSCKISVGSLLRIAAPVTCRLMGGGEVAHDQSAASRTRH